MYFWDTYAVVESIHGNPRYAKFGEYPYLLTIFNLAEIYYFAFKEYTDDQANQIYFKCKKGLLSVSDEVLQEAMRFRKQSRKNLSYTDCIGYICARHNKLVFLTGDKEFEHLANVEFVK